MSNVLNTDVRKGEGKRIVINLWEFKMDSYGIASTKWYKISLKLLFSSLMRKYIVTISTLLFNWLVKCFVIYLASKDLRFPAGRNDYVCYPLWRSQTRQNEQISDLASQN